MDVTKNWRLVVLILVPILLLPVIYIDDGSGSNKFKCLYVILLMGIFWMLEAMPLAITALLPVALFPILGLQSTSSVVGNYMRETGMMFIGGITLALGIERSGLHKRIALRMMLIIGCSPWRVLLGVMVTTFTLSCWIVGNTAVTAMMIPIVIGLVDSLPEVDDDTRGNKKKLKVLYMLATGYAANIGGTAVMIGSIPNLIFKDLIALEDIGQGGRYREINFATWIAFNFPIAVVNLLLVWLYLGFLYLKRPNWRIFRILKCFRKSESHNESRNSIGSKTCPSSQVELTHANRLSDGTVAQLHLNSANKIGLMLREKYAELGRMNWAEMATTFLFALAVILWFTRDPQIFRGWNESLFPKKDISVGDSSVAVFIVLLMFIIPKDLNQFKKGFVGERETLMTWKYIQEHFPWNVILLVGGGFAISDGAEKSGLSLWIGEQLNGLQNLDKALVLLIVLLVVSCFTEITSNAATISLLTPLLIALSKRLEVHPLYLSFAGAIACQYAFILPTSNPPNAIVFTAGEMHILDMVKPGLFLNFACLTVLYVGTLTWGNVLFDFNDYAYPNAFNSSTTTISTL